MCNRVTHNSSSNKGHSNCWKIGRHALLLPLKLLFPLQWTNFIPERMVIIHGRQGQTGVKKKKKKKEIIKSIKKTQ